eukprot:gb/GECG01001069.1/.p1 GENE.gb/GECG01001069.1/~~gb/GECG01001069.1/.p1  ORF type:complete len:424 (+),score=30.22 gb/GECG01001069.1/:1-1272(+)
MFLSKRRGVLAKTASFFPMTLVLGVVLFVYTEYILTLPASYYHRRQERSEFTPSWEQILLVYLPFHLLLAMLLWSYMATTFTHGGRVPQWYTHYYREFNLESLSRQGKGLVLVPYVEADSSRINEDAVLVRIPRRHGSHPFRGTSPKRTQEREHEPEEEESLEEEHPLITNHDDSSGTPRQLASLGERSKNGPSSSDIVETNGDVETGSLDGNVNGDSERNSPQPSDADCASDWAYAHTVSRHIATLHPYGVRWCEKCQAAKPPRSHHCHLMNECILKMDHYCPWVSNCVGFYNYKQFFLFLIYGLLLCSFVLLTWLPAILEGNEHGSDLRYGRMTAFILVASFAVSLIGLGVGHTYFVLIGRSTLEMGEECNPFPFDFGVYNNWILVMGKDWRKWFLPIHTPDTGAATLEGTLFTKNRIENM